MQPRKANGFVPRAKHPNSRRAIEARLKAQGSLRLREVHTTIWTPAQISQYWTDERIADLLRQAAGRNPRVKGTIWNPGPGWC